MGKSTEDVGVGPKELERPWWHGRLVLSRGIDEVGRTGEKVFNGCIITRVLKMLRRNKGTDELS